MKQIWDMSKYISFVFHQKSAKEEIKPCKKEEAEHDYDEEDDKNDSDYSE